MSSPRQLFDVIQTSLTTLEIACAKGGFQIPDLNEPFAPPSEAFRANPTAALAAHTVSAAALHLAAILTPPQVSLYHVVGGHYRSAAVRACLESNVTEILREAGPQGLHIKDIAARSGLDPDKLGRFIRFLAVNHVYREVSPDVFANTRISSMLDTMKSAETVFSDPDHKYDGTVGVAALASHHLDEPFKASAYSWETLSDPSTGHSGDPTASAFARAFKTNETLWQFYEHPEQKYRQRRFDAGMQGIQALQPPDAILAVYDWKDLPAKSVVVDVGGGVGTSAFPLARDFPELKIVVQDRPDVVNDAKKLWSTKMPEAVTSGRVELEAHDFFVAQPKRDVSIFLLKQIMHDWSDEYCAKILKQLRQAAGSKTKLILVESIMPYACHDPSADSGKGIPGAVPLEAPAPLLANFGAVNEMGYNADMTMLVMFNSQERTFHHFESLLREAGWKLNVVRRNHGDSTFLQSIEAVPN
ncbi:S-adenosyl-L-methionine-dependent methyltransferase [Dentipellis sp. KUC8613]|nr:S-adenosyl-L-methionine-dependent methyltransferase [Dentipellis sp. KUC8613]